MSTAQKISQLTTAGPLTGAELVPIVQTSGTLQTTVSTIAAFAVVSIVPVVSALGTQIAQVSAIAAANTTAITSVQADVSALTIRTASVSAVTSVNSAAITSINNVVSALDVRVSVLEIAVSNIGNVSAIAALVSAVASLESTVSALVIQTAAVSALTSVNSAAITSINNTVSALEVRVSTVSAAVSALQIQVASVSANTSVNSAAITSINAVVSALNVAVSADVSAKVNRVGDFMDSVQYIEFDTSTTIATSVGRLHWDIEYGTLDIGLAGGNSNVLIGQREVMYIYNNTSATLTKGKVVEVTGAQGQRLTVKLAQADNDANSVTVLGIMLETVSVNASGYVATDGIVRNVNTAAFTDGQLVYLSPVSAGELTLTKPVAPQHLVLIGYIVKGGSVGGGSIYVKTQNGYELGELHDVKTSSSASIANNEVIAWNTSAGVFTNSTVLLDVQASVSALNIQVAAVSALTSVNAAAITSINAVVSALDTRVGLVSAATSVNAAAITSANAVIAAVSALTSVNTVAIAAVSAAVSTLQVQVNTVSAAVSAVLVSVGQRVLKAGDTMTGVLNISTSADAQAVSVAGYATFSSRVSISAGFYTGLQNYQDFTVQRPTFRDYGLVVVAKGSVSAATSLDLTEGNYFEARAAGSTTFVFVSPPVSVAGVAGRAAGGFLLELQNGGAATVTWPATVDWPGGTAPTLTTSGFDVIVCITDDGGTNWRCVQSMKDSK